MMEYPTGKLYLNTCTSRIWAFISGKDSAIYRTAMQQDAKPVWDKTRPARGGMMLYLPEDAPARSTGQDVLKKMGL